MDENKKPHDSRSKLHSFDWLGDIPGGKAASDVVEVQFKNARKGYYRNTTGLDLAVGDLVAVEAVPGHDIGRVSLTGLLAERRMRRLMSTSLNMLCLPTTFLLTRSDAMPFIVDCTRLSQAAMAASMRAASVASAACPSLRWLSRHLMTSP